MGNTKKQGSKSYVAKGETKPQEQPQEPKKDLSKIKNEYLQLFYLQKKRESLLFGEFSADGKYKLSDELFIKALKEVPKKFDEKIDNVVYANALLGAYILRFKIEFDIKPDYCTSVLKFIEIEQGVEEDIKHVTTLENHLGIYSPTYHEEIYEMWKVYFDEEIYEKNDFLLEYLQKREKEYLFTVELVEVLSQLYLVRMLALLDKLGEKGLKIKQEYKLLVEKLSKNDPGFLQNNTKLKKILDEIIIKHNALDEIVATNEGSSILNEYIEPLKRVYKIASPAIIDASGKDVKEDKKDDKAKAPAKKAGGKKKGKAKSGGGGGLKPFVFDAKKAFGKFKVGGYSAPNLGGAGKPKEKIEIPKAKPNTNPAKPKDKENSGSEVQGMSKEDLEKLFGAMQYSSSVKNKIDGKDLQGDLFDFDIEEIKTKKEAQDREQMNGKNKEREDIKRSKIFNEERVL